MAKTLYELKNIVFLVFSVFFSQPYTQKKDIWYFEYTNKIYMAKTIYFSGFSKPSSVFYETFLAQSH